MRNDVNLLKRCKQSRNIQEFLKFCIVGSLCTCLDAALFYTIRQFVAYQIALISGYLLSLLVNYVLTIYWTFQKKVTVMNAVGVVVVHFVNLFVVRMGLMFLFVDIVGMSDKISYVPTLLISVVVSFIGVKFVVSRF